MVKVNQSYFKWPGVVQDNIFGLKVSLNKFQVKKLMQSSDHLKQYLVELKMVAVLLEVISEIH